MIKKLQTLNDHLLKINKHNPKLLKKHQLIKKILDTPNCFLNIKIEYAYSILRDLSIPEDNLKQTYLKLIDKNTN